MNLDLILVATISFVTTIAWGVIRPKLFPTQDGQDGLSWQRRAVDAETANRVLSRQISDLQQDLDKLKKDLEKIKEENRELRYQLMQHNILMPSVKDRRAADYMKALDKLSSQEIDRLAFGSFQEVYESFGSDQSADWRKLKLVDWCERNDSLPELKKQILLINPVAFDA